MMLQRQQQLPSFVAQIVAWYTFTDRITSQTSFKHSAIQD
jgi:hypothetical protein